MYHPAVPQEPRDDEPRDDDPPKWVREVRQWYAPKPEPEPEQQPDMPPLPNVTDTQRRCVICECLLIFDAPADAQTCAAHRLAEIVRARRIPVVDVGTLAAIREGRIAVRPAIESSTDEAVRFADGRVETFHAIVLATGYETGLDALLGDASPDATSRTGLYFCGFNIVPAGLLREIALEAPRIAAKIRAA